MNILLAFYMGRIVLFDIDGVKAGCENMHDITVDFGSRVSKKVRSTYGRHAKLFYII